MPRARTKAELINFGKDTYNQLLEITLEFEKKNMLGVNVFDNRNIKDIIAHLHAWHLLVLDWYEVGMRGEEPEIPAPGYTFKTTPQLNEKLYQDFKDVEYKDVLIRFQKSHNKIMDLISNHSDEDLEQKKKYKWTGSTNLASYFASATSSHYAWAIDLLKKSLKAGS